MIFKEGKTLEIKIGRVIEEDGEYFIVELDKDGYDLERFAINDLFADFVGDKNVKLKIENTVER
ncbi:MAG: hypothetical protein ACLR4X_10090 [Clostridia bacterium]|jgi:hypothetical protein|nr:MAG TPA: hypothetical protein [Caudoviricetes sp.]DAI89344.1 MAG TPA: hypothetical protein [Caudoviricetes sp.]DAQ91387.1 MAG TPA: hypothetical protein [Caudoviricetes sp.]